MPADICNRFQQAHLLRSIISIIEVFNAQIHLYKTPLPCKDSSSSQRCFPVRIWRNASPTAPPIWLTTGKILLQLVTCLRGGLWVRKGGKKNVQDKYRTRSILIEHVWLGGQVIKKGNCCKGSAFQWITVRTRWRREAMRPFELTCWHCACHSDINELDAIQWTPTFFLFCFSQQFARELRFMLIFVILVDFDLSQ